MRIFKTHYFARWMRKTELTDAHLIAAVKEMAKGLIDADLGGGVVKKRIAIGNRGKSKGVRTLVGTNKGSRWFFLFGFEKNELDNISDNALLGLQESAHDLLELSTAQINRALEGQLIQELKDDKKAKG